ncbi:hypothetical protein GC175_15815 [bacterium]|nr:hypothetical protein [bacterium]
MNLTPLKPGIFFHIYNRGNNRESVFHTPENHRYFLELYARHVSPVAKTYAYCLLPNHFHFLVCIRTIKEQEAWHANPMNNPSETEFQVLDASQRFGNLFNAYAKAFNRAYNRTGSLFQKPFQRNPIGDDQYRQTVVYYIHRNPERHGLCNDFSRWPYSSYRTILSSLPTRLERDSVLGWFGGRGSFRLAHQHIIDDEPDRYFYESPDDLL